MADCQFNITNSDASFIAKQLRKTANQFDPWAKVREAAMWVFIGAAVVASMDYADIWVCVGSCAQNSQSN
ncbi:hypothetical protein [Alloyangia pacifica]|uniref:Uncharacterized protein n=1 Tax=Alloyangia pacifica TaxID=311180 RepID=A0A1I6QKV6_9RHOB|nr:hypothetical protein [Alloyangia pacifica]SDF92182.1 hypothetical protein SAMN04488245_101141 [Alloyangia pacifica]SFS53117.1 hypothetical protein SAMN04488050_102142 [Alloyangia pacifica]